MSIHLKSPNEQASADALAETVCLRSFRQRFAEAYYSTSEDDTTALLRAWFEQIPQAGQTLLLGGGTHQLFPEAAAEVEIFPSNNTAGRVRPFVLLRNKTNVVIDGEGAKLVVRGAPEAGLGSIGVFYTPPLPFVIQDCDNITLRNFSLDWQDPWTVQSEVTESGKDFFVIKIPEERPFSIWGKQLYFSGEGWRMPVRRLLGVKEDTGEILQNSGDNFGLAYDYNWSFEQLDERHVRISGADERLPPVGALILLWLTTHDIGTRQSSAIFIERSSNIRIENVQLHHAVGMGIAAQTSRNIFLDTVIVEPSGNRKFSLNSDASHFVSCRGDISIVNCRFQNQFDDCVNVHGLFFQALRQLDETRVLVRCGHPQHLGVFPFSIGDKIEFKDSATLTLLESNRIKNLSRHNSEVAVIECETSLSKPIPRSCLIENADAYPDVTLRNCDFRWNRARGVLLNGRGKIEVDNCRFENPGAAIMVETSGHWFESGPIRELNVRNCHFKNCAHTPMWGRGVVSFANSFRSKKPIHESLSFTDNFVESINGPLISGSGLKSLVLRNNKIEASNDNTELLDLPDLQLLHANPEDLTH